MINTENGRSMIEMLGVLAIIGVLSVGGIAGYSKAMMKYRINKTIEQISLITANIRSFYASQQTHTDEYGDPLGKYYDLNKNILQKAKLVPDELWNTDKTKLENAFGGNVYISPDAGKDYDEYGTTFVIEYSGIPDEACIELVTKNWPEDFNGIWAQKGSAFYGKGPYLITPDCYASGGGSSFVDDSIFACKSDGKIPVSIDEAIIGCSCGSENCSIAFAAQ